MTFAGKAIALWVVAATAVVSFAWPDEHSEPPSPSATFGTPAGSTAAAAGSTSPPAGNGRNGGNRNWRKATCALPRDLLQRTLRGYFPGRSPEITIVPTEPHFFGRFKTTTTHSGPWDYLQEVPLVLYGPGYILPQGDLALDREVTVADLAPTFARLLGTSFPGSRPGRALTESLVPEALRPEKPRLIMTVVWDGGGWNTLNEWPQTWPNLARLIAGGTSVQGALAGSSPSVTPAIHATMGTGAFPNRHGIVSIPMRRAGQIEESWSGHSPHNLEIETLADMYDRRTRNRAKIGMVADKEWHLGMIGHGAAVPDGDRDIAVLIGAAPFETNPRYYRLPEYLQNVPGFRADVRTIDESDGKRNNKWLGHPVPKNRSEGYGNPVWSLYQMRLLRALLNRERFGRDRVPDLFYTNFKQIDAVSHRYFLQSSEMKTTIPYSDQALGALVRWMNRNVGKENWVLAMTADHGVGPKFTEAGAWPIDMEELQIDIAIRSRARITELGDSQRPQGFWVDRAALRRAGVTRADIANYLVNYRMRDNVRDGHRIPPRYRGMMDQRLFSAAWPSDAITRMSQCKGRA